MTSGDAAGNCSQDETLFRKCCGNGWEARRDDLRWRGPVIWYGAVSHLREHGGHCVGGGREGKSVRGSVWLLSENCVEPTVVAWH